MNSSGSRLCGADWVSERCDIPVERVYAPAREGVLPCVRFGRSVRFDPEKIEAHIAGGGRAFPGGWRREPLGEAGSR